QFLPALEVTVLVGGHGGPNPARSAHRRRGGTARRAGPSGHETGRARRSRARPRGEVPPPRGRPGVTPRRRSAEREGPRCGDRSHRARSPRSPSARPPRRAGGPNPACSDTTYEVRAHNTAARITVRITVRI